MNPAFSFRFFSWSNRFISNYWFCNWFSIYGYLFCHFGFDLNRLRLIRNEKVECFIFLFLFVPHFAIVIWCFRVLIQIWMFHLLVDLWVFFLMNSDSSWMSVWYIRMVFRKVDTRMNDELLLLIFPKMLLSFFHWQNSFHLFICFYFSCSLFKWQI